MREMVREREGEGDGARAGERNSRREQTAAEER